MFRQLGLNLMRKNSTRLYSLDHFTGEPELDKIISKNLGVGSENYYKRNKELSEMLKQKIEEELQKTQIKIKTMQRKINECEKDVKDNLKLLEDLEKSAKSIGN